MPMPRVLEGPDGGCVFLQGRYPCGPPKQNGYAKVNFVRILSTFGDRCPKSGSNNEATAPRTRLKCPHEGPRVAKREGKFFVDNLLVRIHLITEMILVDRFCAMGV